ncbi:hypothetical protein B296_00009880 [Ensete ventricosum]|uniref:Uncharacterized protein n=1 Tax=Ensete ventricosum TaxID=4639 RepID=A0A426YE50_ENSVE|nr:hypothetical protein B296_00009880 [Ensete ventricosum]
MRTKLAPVDYTTFEPDLEDLWGMLNTSKRQRCRIKPYGLGRQLCEMSDCMRLVPRVTIDNGPRSSLGIGPGLEDAVGPCWEFARRFAKGIGKLAGSTLGDHRKKTG